MKSRFSFRVGLVAFALALGLLASGLTVRGQVECIGNCLVALSECNQRTGGSTQCEDEYDACVEDCLGSN